MSDWITKYNDPIEVFRQWFEQAQTVTSFEPTAMTLATVGMDGLPSARIVLLKGYDKERFCFYTNYESVKAQELKENPKAALVFHWEKPFHRQVRIRGLVEKLSYEQSNKYFQSRPRGSQIGAIASHQSHPLENRQELIDRVAELEKKYEGEKIPCPENWGGYQLKPLSVEFWQSQEFRLHDRMKFVRDSFDKPWQATRLSP